MGAGEAGRPLTATVGATEERGADGRPGGAAAGRDDTGKATSAAADKAGAGGRHGAKIEARERVAGRQENPAGESYGVGGGRKGREAYRVATKPSRVRVNGGGREAYGVAENPGGDRQGVGGGVESPQVIDYPGVDALPQGDETPGVATAGEGAPGEGRRGRGGDGTPPTTRATEARGAGGGEVERMGGPRTAALPRPQRGTVVDTDSAGNPPRHSSGTDGARPGMAR